MSCELTCSFFSENIIYSDPQMKNDDYCAMSWDEQLLHGLKRMSYFYTNLAKKMNWDFASVRSPEMDFLPRYAFVLIFVGKYFMLCDF